MSRRLDPLRASIRSILANGGPVGARVVCAQPRAGGWTGDQISAATRGLVRKAGGTYGAVWLGLLPEGAPRGKDKGPRKATRWAGATPKAPPAPRSGQRRCLCGAAIEVPRADCRRCGREVTR